MLSSSSEYPPQPTPGYAEERVEDEDYEPRGLAPTQVTMVTEEAFPYATTAESHYAKEDTDRMQAQRGPVPGTLLG